MRIHCTTTFLAGPTRFEKDDICTVPDADGARFIANGWAVAEGDAPAVAGDAQAVSLDIHNTQHAQGARHG